MTELVQITDPLRPMIAMITLIPPTLQSAPYMQPSSSLSRPPTPRCSFQAQQAHFVALKSKEI